MANQGHQFQDKFDDENRFENEIEEGSGGSIDDSDDDGSHSLSQGGTKSKHKRRSKNDNQGRDFRCGCGKRYLSYPALYTHIKTKHKGQTPTGTNTSQFQTGRGRGRPRKILTLAQQHEDSKGGNENNRKGGKLGQNGISVLEQSLTQEKLDFEQEIIDDLKVSGGPTNALEWFTDTVDPDDRLYKLVQEQQEVIKNKLREINFDEQEEKFINSATIYLINIHDEERQELKIDQILALYLIDLSEKVIVNFYKTVIVFTELMMNCLNENGWNILAKYKRLDNEEPLPLYTSVKDAEAIPEISNEFIVRFIPMRCNILDIKLAVKLTEHLCRWLLHRSLTHSKISLLEN